MKRAGKSKPLAFVNDDPGAFYDPQRHAFRTPSPSARAVCAACGRGRELHAEANEDGRKVKVRNA